MEKINQTQNEEEKKPEQKKIIPQEEEESKDVMFLQKGRYNFQQNQMQQNQTQQNQFTQDEDYMDYFNQDSDDEGDNVFDKNGKLNLQKEVNPVFLTDFYSALYKKLTKNVIFGDENTVLCMVDGEFIEILKKIVMDMIQDRRQIYEPEKSLLESIKQNKSKLIEMLEADQFSDFFQFNYELAKKQAMVNTERKQQTAQPSEDFYKKIYKLFLECYGIKKLYSIDQFDENQIANIDNYFILILFKNLKRFTDIISKQVTLDKLNALQEDMKTFDSYTVQLPTMGFLMEYVSVNGQKTPAFSKNIELFNQFISLTGLIKIDQELQSKQ